MKTTKTLLASVIAASVLSACGGEMLSTSDSEKHKLIPEVVVEDPMAARPSPSAPVMKTDGTLIKHAGGSGNVLNVGVELDYGRDSTVNFDAIEAISEVTAGSLRLVITPETKVEDLEAALVRAATLGMTVNLTLQDERLYCKDNGEDLLKLVKDNWFGKFLPIIAQDRYQPILMISIARGWGPSAVFDPTSDGYREYLDYTKTVIRDFRKRGFKLPLVVEAPGCGEDYNAFDANRVRELLQADTERNLIFGLAAKSARYRTPDRIMEAADVVRKQRAPVMFTEIGGSDVVEKGPKLETILDKAFMDAALSVDPEWQGPNEKAAYLVTLDSPQNIKNTQLTFDIKFDSAYVNADYAKVEGAAKMEYQLYLRDAEGRYASIQPHKVDNGSDSWVTHEYTIKAAMPKTGSIQDGFDMTNVVAIGVELIAQGKPADVKGAVQLDNFRIIEGTGPAVIYASDFSEDVDGWINTDWQAATLNTIADLSVVDGVNGKAMSMVPQANTFEISRTGLSVDLTQSFTISADIFIPADITDFSMGIIAANSSTWTGYGWAGTWNLTPGQWTHYSYTPNPERPAVGSPGNEDGTKLSEAEYFAQSGGNGLKIQFSGFKADEIKRSGILIQNLQIVSAAGAPSSGNVEYGVQHRSDFSSGADGWVALANWENAVALDLTGVDGALSVKPKAAGTRIVMNKGNHSSIEALNFAEGFKFSVTMLIPESLRGKELDAQIFFQDSNYKHNSFEIEPESIVYGEYHTYTIEPEFNGEFDRSLKAAFMGLDFSTDAGFTTADEILIQSIILEGNIPVVPEDVVLAKQDFNRNVTVDVDFTDGAITPEQAAKLSAVIISEPISWFASTWFASDDDNTPYNLVTNLASSGTLTERGEQVVNLPGGLLELRTLLQYVPPAAPTPAGQ